MEMLSARDIYVHGLLKGIFFKNPGFASSIPPEYPWVTDQRNVQCMRIMAGHFTRDTHNDTISQALNRAVKKGIIPCAVFL
jgi:hypothetical protein